MDNSKQPFNINVLEDKLVQCNLNKNIHLLEYLEAYSEIKKFFQLLGRLFVFIQQDIQNKIILLFNFATDDPIHYETILSMVNYEILSANLSHKELAKNDVAIGSKIFLRLHRAFNFFIDFLDGIVKYENPESDFKLSPIAQISYNATLSSYHPWVVRKAVNLAVCALPTKNQLMGEIFLARNANDEANDPKELLDYARNKLKSIIKEAREIYSKNQAIYQSHNLLNI